MEKWLVRTADHWIRGPYSRDELRGMILAGGLKADDEVCAGGRYWFALREHAEVQSQLGMTLPASFVAGPSGSQEEITETDTEIKDHGMESGTTVYSRPISVPIQSAAPAAAPAGARAASEPRMEKVSMLRGFAWLLVAATALILFVILRVIRTMN